MENETKNVIGTVQFYSQNVGGIKLKEDPSTWYNPASKDAKNMIDVSVVGHQVELILDNEDKYKSVVILDATAKQEAKPVNELKFKENEKVRVGPATAELKNPLKKDSDFTKLYEIPLETIQKGPMNLTYASWAEAWQRLKEVHPDAKFEVHESTDGTPVFFLQNGKGAFVKVSVTIGNLTHTIHLPVMDYSNKSIDADKITSFDINKSIMRALVKAIALHGLGLRIYKGEEFGD